MRCGFALNVHLEAPLVNRLQCIDYSIALVAAFALPPSFSAAADPIQLNWPISLILISWWGYPLLTG